MNSLIEIPSCQSFIPPHKKIQSPVREVLLTLSVIDIDSFFPLVYNEPETALFISVACISSVNFVVHLLFTQKGASSSTPTPSAILSPKN